MKRILLILSCLPAAAAVWGQTISSGTSWFNGSSQFEATRNADGSVFMYSMSEGQESEFRLVPIAGKENQFRMEETVVGEEALPIVLWQVYVFQVTAHSVSWQVQRVRLRTVVNLARLEPRLNGRVLLGGCSILRQ